TPWTLPANLAIAVSPKEHYVTREFSKDGATETFVLAEALVEKFCAATGWNPVGEPTRSFPGTKLEGIGAQHPFLPRTAIVLTADFVTMDTGTGAVHIAPGHGDDDYSLGQRNGMPILSPVDDHGRYTDEAGLPQLTGKYVFDANPDIVTLLRERGMLVAEEVYQHSYPYCWRSKTPIIFRAVEQFFIRIDALRGPALEAIKQVKWLPPWGETRISGTVESRPDWVISRQRSWGVPLPAFYSADGTAILNADWIRRFADLVERVGSNIWFELDDEALARELGLPEGTKHRNDTIDVWIDSGVSHQAVLAQRPELRNPADMYLEATDQHRGWFQSSLLTSVALNGRAPYKTCVTHGFVVDVDGKKISKSSSYAKPMDAGHFVGKHGADIVRLWVSSVNYTDDVPFSEEMFTRLGDTYRRIRNTLRILLGNIGEAPAASVAPPEFTLVDRWILDRLQQVIAECREAYASYEFHKVYHTLNQFCAVDLSSLYVDITKDRLYCDAPDAPRRRGTQTAMREIFESLVKLLAPILAFTAEEAWGYSGRGDSVHLQEFPTADPARRDAAAELTVQELLRLRGVIGQAVEQARQEKLIGNALEGAVTLRCDTAAFANVSPAEIEEFFILSDLTIEQANTTEAIITKTPHAKCARCWRHRPSVGTSTAHPELCDRCEEVVARAASPADKA
ncbi:MAG: class I tRNA ligase family protein, partial [Verrucomicrobiota bacterium]|nr:class I tRNA ligase family protein [Verrucomicrobiota bacterium]